MLTRSHRLGSGSTCPGNPLSGHTRVRDWHRPPFLAGQEGIKLPRGDPAGPAYLEALKQPLLHETVRRRTGER